jgi:hypothetical protein
MNWWLKIRHKLLSLLPVHFRGPAHLGQCIFTAVSAQHFDLFLLQSLYT